MPGERLSIEESEERDRSERERRISEGDTIRLSDRPNYAGPEVAGWNCGPAAHYTRGARGVTVTHDSGRVSVVDMLPFQMTAWVWWPENGERAVVSLVVDRFGTDEGKDLRLAVSSCDFRGHEGDSVSTRLIGALRVDRLAALGITRVGQVPANGPGVNTGARVDEPGRGIFLSMKEAVDYLDPSRMKEWTALDDERKRIARVWWKAKRDGTEVIDAVVRAREGAGAATRDPVLRNRASVYVSDLYKRGVLAKVGQDEFCLDVERYYGRGKKGQ